MTPSSPGKRNAIAAPKVDGSAGRRSLESLIKKLLEMDCDLIN
jgi:hypothetical protein